MYLDAELARKINKRIKKLVRKAKYYPSRVFIHRDAHEIVRPYLAPNVVYDKETKTYADVEALRNKETG